MSVPVPPDPKFPTRASFGLVVSGTSINKIAQDGDVLVCLSYAEAGFEIRDGDLAIVERRMAQEGLVEVTAKRVRRFVDRLELHPESTDQRWQTPLVVRGDDVADDRGDVRIVARVSWIYRPVPGPQND